MPEIMNKEATNQSVSFDKIRIGLASPEKIREWSTGEANPIRILSKDTD